MQLQTQFNRLPNFRPLSNNTGGGGSDLPGKLGQAIAKNPILFTADAVDLGAGVTNDLGGLSGAGGDVLRGTSFVMGGYHSVKAFVHLVNGLTDADTGYTSEAKRNFTMLAGEGLTAAGQFCAAAGVGPVALGFLGLGMIVTNASTLSQ